MLKALESESLFKRHFRAVAIFDAGIDVNNRSKLLWKIFNNTDPLRDIKVCGQTCFIDACKKIKPTDMKGNGLTTSILINSLVKT
ncbi:MAG: hypothetical protein ACLUKN_06800 [Bacilli bacterium]